MSDTPENTPMHYPDHREPAQHPQIQLQVPRREDVRERELHPDNKDLVTLLCNVADLFRRAAHPRADPLWPTYRQALEWQRQQILVVQESEPLNSYDRLKLKMISDYLGQHSAQHDEHYGDHLAPAAAKGREISRKLYEDLLQGCCAALDVSIDMDHFRDQPCLPKDIRDFLVRVITEARAELGEPQSTE